MSQTWLARQCQWDPFRGTPWWPLPWRTKGKWIDEIVGWIIRMSLGLWNIGVQVWRDILYTRIGKRWTHTKCRHARVRFGHRTHWKFVIYCSRYLIFAISESVRAYESKCIYKRESKTATASVRIHSIFFTKLWRFIPFVDWTNATVSYFVHSIQKIQKLTANPCNPRLNSSTTNCHKSRYPRGY